MIKDFLRRGKIDENGRDIVAAIVASYPPDIDPKETDNQGKKIATKKVALKLEKTIQNTRHQVRRVSGTLGLGVYGKARLFKAVQTELFNKGYAEDTVRFFMDNIVRS